MVLKILSKATRGKKLIIKEKLRAVEIRDIAGYFGGHILLLLPVYLNVSFTTLTDSYFIYLKNINTDIYVHFKIKGLQNNVNLSSRIQREAENQKNGHQRHFSLMILSQSGGFGVGLITGCRREVRKARVSPR